MTSHGHGTDARSGGHTPSTWLHGQPAADRLCGRSGRLYTAATRQVLWKGDGHVPAQNLSIWILRIVEAYIK